MATEHFVTVVFRDLAIVELHGRDRAPARPEEQCAPCPPPSDNEPLVPVVVAERWAHRVALRTNPSLRVAGVLDGGVDQQPQRPRRGRLPERVDVPETDDPIAGAAGYYIRALTSMGPATHQAGLISSM